MRPDPMGPDPMQWGGVLILGAGLAGLSAALAAAGEGRRALVISPVPLGAGCASAWAQGGMAVAMGEDDDPALHAADTLAAGAGLCDPEAVRVLTTEGPAAVRRLLDLGAPFDCDGAGRLIQSLEAAHSRPRVARVGGDGAGAAIMAAVIAAARADPLIAIWEGAFASALSMDASGAVCGAVLERDGVRRTVTASAVILATGGLGGLYATTTDPAEVRGHGLALAALAGAVIADPEFVQFHPTAIDARLDARLDAASLDPASLDPASHDPTSLDPAPLATEALRGEGATLIDAAGRPFMLRYHPQGDLAPRDVVARAVAHERARGGAWLDGRAAIGAHFPAEFPAVFRACVAAGIDPRVQPIPVTPAVHYHMGGVWTDLDGRSSVSGLYAAGECASTGVHGANRLASNSLLEAAVFGARAGRAAAGAAGWRDRPALAAEPAPILPPAALRRLREAMDRGAGVARDTAGLAGLIGEIQALEAGHGPALELVTARLVAEAALARTHSRGAHFRTDFPETAPARRTLRTLAQAPALMAAE